jgi:hypothetical protein
VPARFHRLGIAYASGALNVSIAGVTTLRDASGQPFPVLSLDPEGLALLGNGRMFVASEGAASALVAPFVRLFSDNGSELRALLVPQDYLPVAGDVSGIRNNLAFESLTLTPDEREPGEPVGGAGRALPPPRRLKSSACRRPRGVASGRVAHARSRRSERPGLARLANRRQRSGAAGADGAEARS